MTIENQRFEYVYPMNHCDFPLPCWFSDGVWLLVEPPQLNKIILVNLHHFPNVCGKKDIDLNIVYILEVQVDFLLNVFFCVSRLKTIVLVMVYNRSIFHQQIQRYFRIIDFQALNI